MGAHRHAGGSRSASDLTVPVRIVHFLGAATKPMVTSASERRIILEVGRAEALVIGATASAPTRGGTHGEGRCATTIG